MYMIDMDTHPLEKMKAWIESEKMRGSENPNRIVLATTSQDHIPHSRIAALSQSEKLPIRESFFLHSVKLKK